MSNKSPVYLNHASVNCALGDDLASVETNLFDAPEKQEFLTTTELYSPGQLLPLGLVRGDLATVAIADADSRNNRLLSSATTPLLAEIERLKSRYGTARIGIVIGTSTSGIAEGEAAVRWQNDHLSLIPGYRYTTQEFSAPTRFLARWLGVSGPAWVVSSACTSGGKALTCAARLLRLGVCDAVVAGGVDTLCRMTVAGFSALQVTSARRCNPFSVNRDGINIGEGAAMFILSRQEGPVRLAGWGETSDAHHISSPDPEGKGAEAAMAQALAMENLAAERVDYVNLHGTGTQQNDHMEGLVAARVFGRKPACGSTKPLTGHTLAAAGAIEALFCWLLLQRSDGKLPQHRWDGVPDPVFASLGGLGRTALASPARYAMSNSFAFGGNNLALLLARV